MATGTGKAYTAFQIIWRLWKSGLKKRILFLADRNALIDQTYSNDFSPFKDKMTIVRNRKVDRSYAVCEQMGRTSPWAEGLVLRADGFEALFYRKE